MREEGLDISVEELNEHFKLLDPENTGYISYEAITLLNAKMQEQNNQ